MFNDTAEIQALVVCGASGTGKTVTAWEIGRTLQSQSVPHALIDTDELDRVWPQPEPVEALHSISRRNLQAIWATFADLGVRRLVLSGVMASIPQSQPWIEDAIAGATIAFVRLTAERDTRERRLRGREVGGGFELEMQASDRATKFIREHDQSGTPVVVTDGKDVASVAEDVLRAVGWFRRP
jgi:ABC-type dipeptide/oligopeptide/nickel transport system ATPase component